MATPDILPWLKTLPLAPEYRPTLSEFQDPIAYIFKIEKQASQYGICKIIPPFPPHPKNTVITNLNRCLCNLNKTDPKNPTFTTRQQQIGFCPKKTRPNTPIHQTIVQKSVWQSGETYTIQQFEAKAKAFAKTRLKNPNGGPLAVETLFWKATADKPFSVEYANDMPGSGFTAIGGIEDSDGHYSEWNMMGVSRGKGSLLRFMPEEIPGVTSPMVYIAMLFSWFAWHVEDHDLHSLNYLHLGAPKTWYGVPRDAAVAFEEVIRVHGYGGQVNPLVAFATLGEKTTVISPEVLIGAGIPCCRLIQNAGEFVVTFPRAYHSGFSHGFNCGEAANIATPAWLRFAKEAAVRRASINYPPMVSHFQLLYALALKLCSSNPLSITPMPRSSRLKDKKRDEGEATVKEIFVENVIQNNYLLHILLEKGSTCVLLPQNSSDISLSSTSCVRSQIKIKPRLSPGLCSQKEEPEISNSLLSSDMPDRGLQLMHLHGFHPKGKSVSACQERRASSGKCFKYEIRDPGTEKQNRSQGDGPSDQGVLSCVTCGILGFACMAILQPSEEAVRVLASGCCNIFNGQLDGSANKCNHNLHSGLTKWDAKDGLDDTLVKSGSYQVPVAHEVVEPISDNTAKDGISALDLLASTYGAYSDSEDESVQSEMALCTDDHDIDMVDSSLACNENQESRPWTSNFLSLGIAPDGETELNSLDLSSPSDPTCCGAYSAVSGNFNKNVQFGSIDSAAKNRSMLHLQSSDVDSSRMHIFCLEHAMEVEKQLRSIGGAHVMLLCNSDYPTVEAQAKLLAGEMGIQYPWKDIQFREATKEDQEKIRSALDDDEIIHGNGDWAVKLGVNLFYSANLSRSPLYSKQMPYNPVLYEAFGRNSVEHSPEESKVQGRFFKQKKLIVAGRWCGKIWMVNQVHPYLANRGAEEHVSIDKLESLKIKAEQDVQEKSPIRDLSLPIRRAGKKRRKAFVQARNKKSKTTQWDTTESEDSHSNPQEFGVGGDFQGRVTKQGPPSNRCTSNDDRGPSRRLRRRPPKLLQSAEAEEEMEQESRHRSKKRKRKAVAIKEAEQEDGIYNCDIENCIMSFDSKQELLLHKKNICVVQGCAKKFFSHKYLVQHRRVHMEDRPLKCPWKGCKMTFKWAWAKTEHIRVHTGARPYVCKEAGCGKTFRFVSDFSRHKRKTGHSTRNRE